jgi:hypothetical protein
METCPICKAPYGGKRYCHRCGADLDALKEIQESSRFLLAQTRAFFEKKEYEAMYHHAKKAVSKETHPTALKALALAALLTSRFKTALSTWRYLNHKTNESQS